MLLKQFAVVIPYRLHDRTDAPQYTIHADVIASDPGPAGAVAKVLCRAASFLHHGTGPLEIFVDRTRISAPLHAVGGPYCYVFTRGDRLPAITLPRRIDHRAGTDLQQTLAGLDRAMIHGVVMDLAQLATMTSAGIAALAEHSRRIGLHLCRVPPVILQSFEAVGMTGQLHIHADLRHALEAMIREARSEAQQLEERGFVPRGSA